MQRQTKIQATNQTKLLRLMGDTCKHLGPPRPPAKPRIFHTNPLNVSLVAEQNNAALVNHFHEEQSLKRNRIATESVEAMDAMDAMEAMVIENPSKRYACGVSTCHKHRFAPNRKFRFSLWPRCSKPYFREISSSNPKPFESEQSPSSKRKPLMFLPSSKCPRAREELFDPPYDETPEPKRNHKKQIQQTWIKSSRAIRLHHESSTNATLDHRRISNTKPTTSSGNGRVRPDVVSTPSEEECMMCFTKLTSTDKQNNSEFERSSNTQQVKDDHETSE